MIKSGEIIAYRKNETCKGIVLEENLKQFAEKARIKLVEFPTKKYNKLVIATSLDQEACQFIESLLKNQTQKSKELLQKIKKK
jgi:hypothetical protein